MPRWRPNGRPVHLQERYQKIGISSIWTLFVPFWIFVSVTNAMSPRRISELRQETISMFYHGFDNYMDVAFPEDELRPITCAPLTRDQNNPQHFELNDVLGNYSLTLIDSLSTLAILASAPSDKFNTGANALRNFQDGVEALVVQYGDGTDGPSGTGVRARGFDLDSKVQVFETVIRGVGGLLSAHLFAAGELPIKGYRPQRASEGIWNSPRREIHPPILWPNGFRYDGQLLRLAKDLAERLLPAFFTDTGMPYPRVNLRYGVPFYQNSPLNRNPEGECSKDGSPEITETCSAGAGSLVLEFTVLSRLTGDPRFEQLAKRAFWSVWSRRSSIGLIGAGVDAEQGHWVGSYAGIGAGADSFFEYALKTHILLSGHDAPNTTVPHGKRQESFVDPNKMHHPLSDAENSADTFLHAWQDAHAAIKRHLYSNTHHPHYVNVHLRTGSPQAYWIDSLGAYYPGLLALAGELEEAIETNLLYTALWTRYAALPERWSLRDKQVEGGLGWWPGRPEFIESNYHIYRATKDPWYLHVGEMVLEDINRRCWTECGWSGLQDVRTGEKSDRMESFFLGETAKYLYLMFDPDHPLNSLDAPYVFTTEGHPVIIPRKPKTAENPRMKAKTKAMQTYVHIREPDVCPVPPPSIPFTISATAARDDIFHAASLIELHSIRNLHAVEGAMPKRGNPIISMQELLQFPNHTYYPRTLPRNLVPINATCTKLPIKLTSFIEFPSTILAPLAPSGFNTVLQPQGIARLENGILIKNLQGLKLGMVKEDHPFEQDIDGTSFSQSWRIWNIGDMALGRDEKVFVSRDVIGPMVDPIFTRIRSRVMFDLILQFEAPMQPSKTAVNNLDNQIIVDPQLVVQQPEIRIEDEIVGNAGLASDYKTMLSSILQQVSSALRDPVPTIISQSQVSFSYHVEQIEGIAPTGIGAASLQDWPDAPDPKSPSSSDLLSWKTAYFAGYGCDGKLPDEAVKSQLIIMRRGGCSFNTKVANIPSHAPTSRGFQFLIIVSEDEVDQFGEKPMIRPLMDEIQSTPAGLLRHHMVVMGMVGGGEAVYDKLKSARSFGIRRRYHVESQGVVISNLIVV